jgi:hypothetical protein
VPYLVANAGLFFVILGIFYPLFCESESMLSLLLSEIAHDRFLE